VKLACGRFVVYDSDNSIFFIAAADPASLLANVIAACATDE
jgi:hypothetical protein